MSGGECGLRRIVSACDVDIKGVLTDSTVGIGDAVVNGDGLSVVSSEVLVSGISWIEGPSTRCGIDGQAIDGRTEELIGELITVGIGCCELTGELVGGIWSGCGDAIGGAIESDVKGALADDSLSIGDIKFDGDGFGRAISDDTCAVSSRVKEEGTIGVDGEPIDV